MQFLKIFVTTDLAPILKIGSGLFWTITYVLIIQKGFKEKTYGMPFMALCANISWEFIFSFIHPHSPLQQGINIVWFVFDAVIVYQFLRWGYDDYKFLKKWEFGFMQALGLVTAFCLVLFSTYVFEPEKLVGAYAAFGQNLMMSVLFIIFFFRRNGNKGQSWHIALTKLIGTAIASFYFLTIKGDYQNPLMYFLYVSILLFDLIYLSLLLRDKFSSQSIN